MGSNEIRRLILVMILHMLLIPYVRGLKRNFSSSYNRNSLDSFVYDYALQTMGRIRTGTLYNVSLPANYSGIQVSFVRLRSGNLRRRGANLSFFAIPPRILPKPFPIRLNFVIENLGDSSALYYNVPNHTFVTPVVGLLAYDANISLKNSGNAFELNAMNNPISVHFPEFSRVEVGNATTKCVRFGTNGEVEFSNVTAPSQCREISQGHFAIVTPSLPPVPSPSSKKGVRYWKWWVIGFGVGFGGLIVLIVSGILLFKLIRVKRIAKMERQTEKSEALETIWIGSSRMHSASGIRTQPVLENSYVP